MMAQMKVHGISDKAMGLSSPRTRFFISLEPVKVLSAKYGRTHLLKGFEYDFFLPESGQPVAGAPAGQPVSHQGHVGPLDVN